MELKHIYGNIVDSNTDIIVHQVNCQFVMGSGVAKAIKEKWPKVYKEYKNYKIKSHIEYPSSIFLGNCQIVTVSDKYIANLFGQDFYGRDGKQYTNYQALECSLYNLKKFILFGFHNKITSIAFPWRMGAGLGGGDWQIIKNIIEKVFADTDLIIEYWELQK